MSVDSRSFLVTATNLFIDLALFGYLKIKCMHIIINANTCKNL